MSNIDPFMSNGGPNYESPNRSAFVVGVFVGAFGSLPTVTFLAWLVWRHTP